MSANLKKRLKKTLNKTFTRFRSYYWSTAANTSLRSLHFYPTQPRIKINQPRVYSPEHVLTHSRLQITATQYSIVSLPSQCLTTQQINRYIETDRPILTLLISRRYSQMQPWTNPSYPHVVVTTVSSAKTKALPAIPWHIELRKNLNTAIKHWYMRSVHTFLKPSNLSNSVQRDFIDMWAVTSSNVWMKVFKVFKDRTTNFDQSYRSKIIIIYFIELILLSMNN